MVKTKNELLLMLKNELIELAEKEGISVKPYWTKEKIIDVFLQKEKTFSVKKESIAKDFKKRWMDLTKLPEGEEGSKADGKSRFLKKSRSPPVGAQKEIIDRTQKLEKLMAKEQKDKGRKKSLKKMKHERKLLKELDMATNELDKDMMEKFKKDHVDISEYEKAQKQIIAKQQRPPRTQTFGPKMSQVPSKVAKGARVPLSSIGWMRPPSAQSKFPKGLKKSTGLVNGNGLTNGKGIINGLTSRGLVNGKGIVNGSTQGFVNGKSKGIINGKGLMPSAGQGVTNGVGIVNGIYRKALINGNGLTNGNGITNGTGLSIQFLKGVGTGPSKIIRRLARINIIQNRIRRDRLAIALVIIALIFAPILFFLSDIQVEEGMDIDGEFADWSEIERFEDDEYDQLMNPNINIMEYSATEEDDELLFYIKTKEDVFEGYTSERAYAQEILNIFIDIDSNSTTGYSISEFGADYRMELSGIGREIKGKTLYKFAPESNKHDWNEWQYLKTFDAQNSGLELEARVKFDNNGYNDPKNARIIFIFKDYLENSDQSDMIITPGKPAILIDECVVAPPAVPYNQTKVQFLKLILYPQGISQININGLEFLILGTLNNSLVNSLNLTLSIDRDRSNDYSVENDKIIQSQVELFLENANNKNDQTGIRFNFNQDLTIFKEQPMEVLLLCDISSNLPKYSTLGFKTNPKLSNPDYTITLTSTHPVGCDSPFTYIGGVPDKIIIDGAFADWDPIHEYFDSDRAPIINLDVDINSYKIHQENEKLSFFFQVKGDLFGGTSVAITPNLISRPELRIDSDNDGVPDILDPNPNLNVDSDLDNWSDDYEDIISLTNKSNRDTDGDFYIDSQDLAPLNPEIPPISPKITIMDGNDTAIIFIDTDQNKRTGFSTPGFQIGAEYMLRVRGKYGYILNSSLLKFNGNDRLNSNNFSFYKNIKIGTDSHKLETQLTLTELGIFTTHGVDVIFFIHDWDKSNSDMSDSILASDLGLKPTTKHVTVLNQVSYPQDGEWRINFITTGTGIISIGNHSFPANVDFKGLYFLNPTEQLYYRVPVGFDIANRTIKADWRYQIGLVIFEPRTDEEHLIEIIFGNIEYAMMNASNESRAELIQRINSSDISIFTRLGDNTRFIGAGSRAPSPWDETKTLYLIDDGTNYIMNTTKGKAQSSTNTRIMNQGNHSWLQKPAFAGDFNITDTILVYLYLDPQQATGPGNEGWPDITVNLTYGSTLIGSETKTNVSTADWYIFSISPLVTSVPESNKITIEAIVTSAAAGGNPGNPGYIDVYYNSETRDSRINLKTDTYIDINWIKLYNQSGNETYVFEPGDTMTIRANITDPLGLYDIKYVNTTMLLSDESINPNLNDVTMTEIYDEDTTAPYFWRVYEYNYSIPSGFSDGWYTLWVNATESNGVRYGLWKYFINPPVLGVSIFPDTTEFVTAGTEINYSFTVKNIGDTSDIYDISINASNQGWRSDLYFNDTLVAYDSNGDGTWDWIYSNYDSNIDGNPDINLTPLEEYEIVLKKTIPPSVGTKTDVTILRATSQYNTSLYNDVKAKSVVSGSKKIKNLYLHSNHPKKLMSTFEGTSSSSTNIRINNDKSDIWEMSPVFASGFNIVGDAEVYLYIDPTPGTGWRTEGNPDVMVTLKYGSTTIGTNTIENIESAQWYTFHIVPGVTTIPEGSAITMEISVDNAKRGRWGDDGYIDLYFDSSSYNSRIDLPTDTYINIQWLKTYNLTSNEEENGFIMDEYVEIRANVTDPFGVQDTTAYVYITSPGGSYGDVANGILMNNYTTDPTAPYFWQVYNYSYQLSSKPINGTYNVDVVAKETNGVTWNVSSTYNVFGANVSITPDHYQQQVNPGTNISYAHTISNNARFSDRFDISITSSQGWKVTIYYDSNSDGVLDSGDQIMGYDSNGDGSWDWVNSSFDSDTDGEPDTGLLGGNQNFRIMVVVEVPSNASSLTDVTEITVTSNYDIVESDTAVDTTVTIPEYSSLIIPIGILIFTCILVKKSSYKKTQNLKSKKQD
jgi:hypothetical protein